MTDRTNQGEGNRTAARHYNDSQKAFAESGKVGTAADKAVESVDGPEGEALRAAEQAGKQRAHGEDRAVKRGP
jgi:hypothetical protein